MTHQQLEYAKYQFTRLVECLRDCLWWVADFSYPAVGCKIHLTRDSVCMSRYLKFWNETKRNWQTGGGDLTWILGTTFVARTTSSPFSKGSCHSGHRHSRTQPNASQSNLKDALLVFWRLFWGFVLYRYETHNHCATHEFTQHTHINYQLEDKLN